MNLAVEYLLRDGKAAKMINLPFALFLNHNIEYRKLIVTVSLCYGFENLLNVKHWNLSGVHALKRLPPVVEYQISKTEMTTSPHVIVPNYYLLPFEEKPFETGSRQHTDTPQADYQEQEFRNCLDSFYNPPEHHDKKTDWLWTAYEKNNVPEDLKFIYGHNSLHGKKIQRDLVQFYSTGLWNRWKFWRKHLLDFPNWIAPELAFQNLYPRIPESTVGPWQALTYAGAGNLYRADL